VSGVYHGIQVYDKVAQINHDLSCQSVVIMFAFINYVSEHQLPHVMDASHTTSTTHVNLDPMLLKLIDWKHSLCLKWVSYIPGTMT